MIRNYCEKGDIVFDVDPDDSLIGKQTFQVLNAQYQSSNNWVIYANHVYLKPNKRGWMGISKTIPDAILKQNTYRTEEWRTSALRTYLRDLYVKILPEYLIEDFKTQKYYSQADDQFIMRSVVELAGFYHTHYLS